MATEPSPPLGPAFGGTRAIVQGQRWARHQLRQRRRFVTARKAQAQLVAARYHRRDRAVVEQELKPVLDHDGIIRFPGSTGNDLDAAVHMDHGPFVSP